MVRATTRNLKRRPPSRKWRRRIIIVTEGEKTEGIYLSYLIRAMKMTNVLVEVMGKECGSDPLTVIKFAKDQFNADASVDACFCIIDRDSHPLQRYNTSLEIAKQLNNKSRHRDFQAFVSDPCIEVWFILHFTYWRAPFVSQGGKSRGDCAVDKLREYLPKYSKNSREELAKLVPLTKAAVDHANRVMEDVEKAGEVNPSTDMHHLVLRLEREAVEFG